MNKKLYHIEFKSVSHYRNHFYYGDLTILCNTHEIGISKFTLDRWNFETPFDNEICIIRKSELFVSTRCSKIAPNVSWLGVSWGKVHTNFKIKHYDNNHTRTLE